MRKLFVVVAITAAAAAPAYAASKTVKIGDDWFVKPGNGNATVTKGTQVTWKNTGDSPHNVKVTKGPVKFSSSTLLPGKRYTRTMRKRGTYTIICTIHGSKQKMTLRVK